MARRRLQRKVDNDRPVVTDDFIYNDPETSANTDSAEVSSDTPEEAIRKLRRRNAPSNASKPDTAVVDSEESPSEASGSEADSSGKKVYSSGIMLDDNLQPIYDESVRRPRKRHPVLRGILLGLVTVSLLVTVAAYIFHRIIPTTLPWHP